MQHVREPQDHKSDSGVHTAYLAVHLIHSVQDFFLD